jgi:hypothetical protein
VNYGYCRQGKANAPYTSDIASITPDIVYFSLSQIVPILWISLVGVREYFKIKSVAY